MNQRNRVDGQPAFVLHAYPYSETSLIADVFSRDYGRLPLLARGARRPRSVLRGLLLAFQPLELAWAGSGEVKTLIKAEWQGGQPLLAGRSLFCAYYLNELLMQLLPREDAHVRLFAVYAETLQRFAISAQEGDLRRFERVLLQELGYGPMLEIDVEGLAVDTDADYVYEVERGPVRVSPADERARSLRGQTLIDLAREDFSNPRSLVEAKQLMRTLIGHYTGGRKLVSRAIYRELHEL
ncbi:MAG TPA: DNA repair protein RecO [Accumulibacter sp.]|uniref:DNA repair protein RecO n=1 Tax=Accumulibacter sp. TaxID=2053492 RepID=UPI0026093944|nr:DNA repair protein RecO [Accumulibacter sp.]HMW79739.1 DNA repair protein RecO [Accumulibacter sp.]HNH91781.1 DNA repair protein RecO [Accumulibacter sp.]HNL96121.1 DNA repair protein RecO [Accumulibacter sp.]